MTEKTIQMLRDFAEQHQLSEVAEEMCRQVVFQYLKAGQIGSYNLANYFQNLQTDDFELHSWRLTIHLDDDTPFQFTVVFGIEISEEYNKGIHPFAEYQDDPTRPKYLPEVIKCDLTLALQLLKAEIRTDESDFLHCYDYQPDCAIDEFWQMQLGNLEKQIKDIALIAKAQQASLDCPYGQLGKIDSEADLPAFYECSYTFTTFPHELGYFVVAWHIEYPNSAEYDIYQYFMDPLGAFLRDSHRTYSDAC